MSGPGANSSFSRALPGLQLAIDSTSLGEFKVCPRRYWFGIVQGWRQKVESVHLTFGLLMHGAAERYAHGRAQGASHDQALAGALHWALAETWNYDLHRPWASDHRTKNRATLVRSIVWYLDDCQDEALATVQLANGKPAVELSFVFDSGYRAQTTGEAFLYCGHLDRLGTLGDEVFIVDLKTTEHTIGPDWFKRFTPGNQFSLYALAGRQVWQQPVKGLIVDGLQVAQGFTRHQRGLVAREPPALDEWHYENGWWFSQMEHCAVAGRWPGNDRACDLYGGCPFREVCSRPPGARQAWLEANYTKRVWDPLQRRGDI
jgi:hypothetical protein